MRIKVPTPVLLKKAEDYLAARTKQNEKDTEQYNKAKKKFDQEVSKVLAKVAEQLNSGEEYAHEDDWEVEEFYKVSFSKSSGIVSVSIQIPGMEVPKSPSWDDWRVRRDIEALKATKSTELTVGPDDQYWQYLDSPEKGLTGRGY